MWQYNMCKQNDFCFKSAYTQKGHLNSKGTGGTVSFPLLKKPKSVMYWVCTVESIHNIIKCKYVENIMINGLEYTGSTQTTVWAKLLKGSRTNSKSISPSKLFQSAVDVCSRCVVSPDSEPQYQKNYQKIMYVNLYVHFYWFWLV